MKLAENTGIITRATNSDELSTMIRVIGSAFMNSPVMPPQNARGRNALSVVAVEVIIGNAISPTANLAASNGLYPLLTKR